MNSNSVDLCVHYFKSRNGFERVFLEMKKKWQSYGKIAGKIRISDATEEEKKELEHFFGIKYWDKDIEFSFVKFEEALRNTRYNTVTISELLQGYFGEKIISNQDNRILQEEKLESFWNHVKSWVEEHDLRAASYWIDNMRQQKNSAYSYVNSLWKKEEKGAENILKSVCRAISYISLPEMEEIQLAVLAAKVSGNPHFFDRGRPASQLLIQAVCEKSSLEMPKNAEEIQKIYETVGIILDEISSTVTVYGIHMVKSGKMYTPLEESEALGEAMTLSLANLRDAEKIYSHNGVVLVVENEMVYCHLLEKCVKNKISIICTSGQLSRAAQKVLQMLCKEGNVLYYSGDIDPEGLKIADNIWKKYTKQFRLWRMSEEDYFKCVSEEGISEQRLEKMSSIQNPDLFKTCGAVRKKKKAGYQENIIELLEEDLVEISRVAEKC